MPAETPIADVAHVIQLSVAPVFLLTALGTILGVLSTRLGRIVDRSRVLGERLAASPLGDRPGIEEERALLQRRRRLVNLAITCGTGAALLVSSVIISAFLGFILGWRVSGAIAVLFICAMVCAMAALVLFLSEVLVAVTNVDSEHRTA
jgi:Protein of unknown function (DUF2721)